MFGDHEEFCVAISTAWRMDRGVVGGVGSSQEGLECPVILEQWELRKAKSATLTTLKAEFWQQRSGFVAREKPRQEDFWG